MGKEGCEKVNEGGRTTKQRDKRQRAVKLVNAPGGGGAMFVRSSVIVNFSAIEKT